MATESGRPCRRAVRPACRELAPTGCRTLCAPVTQGWRRPGLTRTGPSGRKSQALQARKDTLGSARRAADPILPPHAWRGAAGSSRYSSASAARTNGGFWSGSNAVQPGSSAAFRPVPGAVGRPRRDGWHRSASPGPRQGQPPPRLVRQSGERLRTRFVPHPPGGGRRQPAWASRSPARYMPLAVGRTALAREPALAQHPPQFPPVGRLLPGSRHLVGQRSGHVAERLQVVRPRLLPVVRAVRGQQRPGPGERRLHVRPGAEEQPADERRPPARNSGSTTAGRLMSGRDTGPPDRRSAERPSLSDATPTSAGHDTRPPLAGLPVADLLQHLQAPGWRCPARRTGSLPSRAQIRSSRSVGRSGANRAGRSGRA